MLDVICCAKQLEPLSLKEKEFLKNLYVILLDQFNKEKDKLRYAFPGCGDRKKLNDGFEPWGDFFIYHEILALMKELDCDAMFITNDVAKSDWVQQNRRPFMHYLFDEFSHTGHMINIVGLDAIPMDITPIIPDEEDPHEGALDSQMLITDVASESESGGVLHKQDDNKETESSRLITEEQFLEELTICIGWATNYGGGYVNEEFFLRNILRSKKNYDYNHSKEVLQKLTRKKIVRIEEQEHSGNTYKCLVWGEKHIE